MPKYTKEHHAQIARRVANTRAKHGASNPALATMQGELAELFADDNPDFSPSEFEAECTPERERQRA